MLSSHLCTALAQNGELRTTSHSTHPQLFVSDEQVHVPIAVAGNVRSDGRPTDYNYPGACPDVVSVTSVNQDRQRSDFAVYNNQVDLAAPGATVWSSVPRSAEAAQGYYFTHKDKVGRWHYWPGGWQMLTCCSLSVHTQSRNTCDGGLADQSL